MLKNRSVGTVGGICSPYGWGSDGCVALCRGGGRATSGDRRLAIYGINTDVSIPAAEAGGVRRARSPPIPVIGTGSSFNPRRRGGGRATWRWMRSMRVLVEGVSIPSAEAGGVRRPICCIAFRSSRIAPVSIPSAEAGGVRPSSQSDLVVGKAAWSFNPLRRGGGRATRLMCKQKGYSRARTFQSPPPRRGACDRITLKSSINSRSLSRFNPLRRGGGRATDDAFLIIRLTCVCQFQSPPPRRGACDRS